MTPHRTRCLIALLAGVALWLGLGAAAAQQPLLTEKKLFTMPTYSASATKPTAR